eukprot:Nitzschia sp. Nitz4//scaffold92_size79448//9347//11720//NITZ4_005382-RA/size79448-augustus-gene-0.29-mRNA-1//-1//CDS//3329560159//1677//frame0
MKAKPKHTKRKKKPSTPKEKTSWVDNSLVWKSVSDDSAPLPDPESLLSVVSWNVLADSYCNSRSHKCLPKVYQDHVFRRKRRHEMIHQVLQQMVDQLQPDVIALQEVDPPLEVPTCMRDLGYDGLHTPTDPSAKDGRVDACALYYDRERWKVADHTFVRLDDLAIQQSTSTLEEESSEPTAKEENDEEPVANGRPDSNKSHLYGVQASYVRKNMGLLVKLQHRETKQQVVFAVVHLFWNPQYPDIKLCQTHQIVTKAHAFAQDLSLPIILLGDTNSVPSSAVYDYLSNGSVNAKRVAPWYRNYYETQELSNPTDNPHPKVRYLLDASLNRLCRWLRILGIDAALETEEEEVQRTQQAVFELLDRCRDEQRTLITTSTKLIRRKDCPPGAYLLDTYALTNLEASLVHLLNSHGVILRPNDCLSRCVVCNGEIEDVDELARRAEIFATHQAPERLLHDTDLDVYQCVGCGQGYWYDDRPTSSASRVKNQATKLLQLCHGGGVTVDGDWGMFGRPEEESSSDPPINVEAVVRPTARLDILEWLQDEQLTNPWGPMTSAYATTASDTTKAATTERKEVLEFTNMTHDFVGLLDYIFSTLPVVGRLNIPQDRATLNEMKIHNGHLLPSKVWPSDHLAIGACYQLPVQKEEKVQEETKEETPPPVAATSVQAAWCPPTGGASVPPPSVVPVPVNHDIRCACGCVPAIPSLFEMAEMRRKAREKKLKET